MSAIIKTPAVSEQVTDFLKQKITDGRWAPGTRISSENELTRELGVSRASVRSGIKQLEALGILESHQGKGTFVRAIPAGDISEELGKLYKTNKDMHDLLEFRMILETECCRLAEKRMTEDALTELRAEYERMKAEFEKKDTRSGEVFADSDFGFHRLIYIATGNRLMIDSMRRITEETERYQRQFNTDYLSKKAVYYHEKILKAFEEHNGEKAAKAMRDHLTLVIEEYDKLLLDTE